MHPCKTVQGVEVEKCLGFFFFSKLLTTLKIQVYFKMITLWPVRNLGQMGFQKTLSSITENKLSNLKMLTRQVLQISVKEMELINHQ